MLILQLDENGQPERIQQVIEQEVPNSHGELPQSSTVRNDWKPHPGFDTPETKSILPSIHDGIGVPISADGNTHVTVQNKPQGPRNPLIDEVVAIEKSKLRKVERVKPPVESNGVEGEFLLGQLQLRKAGGRSKPLVESKTEEIRPLLEQLQLREVVGHIPWLDQKPKIETRCWNRFEIRV
ncbi:hypothetical protein Cgig2_012266 [Carnegiea gigantea]|uniref:Uncharacterized protein n=1 Tax=Carnegiea gigantea TaxID=171969 RepID=A0A9Q1QCT0_9CARY|nr:hypothetical protein Cgig2_012266 [Carnegiea gigantea]